MARIPAIYNLGQVQPGQTQATQYEPVVNVYDEMRALCLSKLPADVCDGLLPARYLYYPPEEKPVIPWWFFIICGIVIGKMI